MMRRRRLITLPDDVNPGGLLTVKRASQITGIPKTTIYNWRQQPGNGIRFYRIGHKLFLKCDELLRWIDAHAEVVDQYGWPVRTESGLGVQESSSGLPEKNR